MPSNQRLIALRRPGESRLATELRRSYMVTGEERHSTRGRARLLFEMLDGELIEDGWRSDAVFEALDLCLACKGCKRECPVHVDMATYKAEFMAHHYDGRLRPRSAYSLGWIHRWACVGARVPRIANLLLQTPGSRALAKWLAGSRSSVTFHGLRRGRFAGASPAGRRPSTTARACCCGPIRSMICSFPRCSRRPRACGSAVATSSRFRGDRCAAVGRFTTLA